jgi:phage tail-like protein
MIRGLLGDLASPFPFGSALPAIYQEDPLTMRLAGAFDEILAPAVNTIDNLTAYLDPALTPDDFLDWLAGWVGVLLDETWPVERRRAFVAVAAELYRTRGTAAGLAAQVRLFTSGDVEVIENGGSAWSSTPDAAAPGSPGFSLRVRVTPAANGKVDVAKLDELVATAKPAHVAHSVELVSG